MLVRLRDNLYWCVCGDRAVFLDSVQDRYFSLPTLANHAFLRLAAGERRTDDYQHLRSLVSRGLLLEDDTESSVRQPHVVEPPTGDFLPEPDPGAPLLEVLKTLFWEMRAGWLLGKRPLVQLLGPPAVNRSKLLPKADEAHRLLRRIVSASAAASLITRAHDRCLVRALGLRARCSRSGFRTTLVLGVRANPFAAHCWLQLGSTVLVGEFEQARLYTPILVVQ